MQPIESREPDLHATVSAIYEAAVDPRCWDSALDRIIDFSGAERGLLGVASVVEGTAGVRVLRGIDASLLPRFEAEFGSRDPFIHESDRWLEAGSVKHAGSLFDQTEFRDAPIYSELLVPAGMVDVVNVILSAEHGVHTHVGVYQGVEAGLFGEPAISAMTTLAPHLTRAMTIDRHLCVLERRRQLTEAALNQLRSSVVVVDEAGHVEFANRAAEALLSEADGIRIANGALRCDQGATAKSLRRHLREALEHSSGVREAAGGTVPIRRPSGRRTLSALVAPLARRLGRSLGLWNDEAPAAIVVFSEPERVDDSPEPLLRELFGLTSAEARVVWALARGLSPEEHAEEAGVALSTVRWQLKQAFSKTDTRRQAELVALVLRSLGPFRL